MQIKSLHRNNMCTLRGAFLIGGVEQGFEPIKCNSPVDLIQEMHLL